MNHEDAYLRDQQFEFATSHYIFIYLYIIVLLLCVLLLNKLLHFVRRSNVFVDSVHHPDPIGVGKKNP